MAQLSADDCLGHVVLPVKTCAATCRNITKSDSTKKQTTAMREQELLKEQNETIKEQKVMTQNVQKVTRRCRITKKNQRIITA